MSIPLSLQTLALLLLTAAGVAPAAETKLATEEDYYRIFKLPIPDGVVLEVGSLEFFPDGKLAASSRRGDIYTISNPFATASSAIEFRRYASGLHEVLGLAWRGGWLYATQRGELSRLKDINGNGRADVIETVNADWEITGDYHEYALGSRFDHNGDLWIALCLTGSFTSDATFRGWCLRGKPDGTMVPTCSGLRSPGGIGMNNVGDMFYTDNQGPWNGTCALKHLAPGSFQGHPAGNRWYAATDAIGPRPLDPVSNTRMLDEATRIPQLLPPAVLFPYKKMGQSASGIACDRSGGKFGPFAGQLFVADQTFSSVMRVYLEKVNGQYQGACFPFRQGFSSGNLALLAAPQGGLFVGGTNRGWGSRGNQGFALERLDWTGKVPFEVHAMRALPDGFELTFTQPLQPETAVQTNAFELTTYTYIYQSSYGSPEVDHTRPTIVRSVMGADRKSVRLVIDALRVGHVHELHLPGIRSAAGAPLLHDTAYYTLNHIPDAD